MIRVLFRPEVPVKGNDQPAQDSCYHILHGIRHTCLLYTSGGGYAVTTDYVEAKSLATVCVLILQEVEEERRRRSEERE